jgi:hypothetical protein
VKKSNVIAFKADKVETNDEFIPEKKDLSTEEKQKLIKSARNKASGWSTFGGPFSTLYYACRSNKTIAKKYNLDEEKDKDLIKNIKHTQTIWTLPAVIGFGIIGYIVSNSMSSKNIEV